MDVLAERWRLWGSFAVADRTLLAFARRDPLGLQALAETPLAGATTMDVPFYGFFTPAERHRAVLRLVYIHIESLDAFDRLGLECLPLVKGLSRLEIDVQVELLGEAGARSAAFYARELLLEKDHRPLRHFAAACARHQLRPVFLGAARPVAAVSAAVSVQHAVAALRGERITHTGRRRRVDAPFQSTPLARWVRPGDVASLSDHNLLSLRRPFIENATLAAFGA
jgi:hypothetical protein